MPSKFSYPGKQQGVVYVDFATLMLYHTGVPLINQQRRFDSASFFHKEI